MFEVTVNKIRAGNIGINKTAAVKIGFVKGGIGNEGSSKVDAHKLRALESAVPYGGTCHGHELKITVGKIAGIKGSEIKKSHPHQGLGKKTHGKSSPGKIASEKLLAGKIAAFKMQALGGNVFYNSSACYIITQPLGLGFGVGGVYGAEGRAGYSRTAATGGAEVQGKHEHIISDFFHIE